MRRPARSRRPLALIAAIGLHALLALVVVLRAPPREMAEPRAMEVTLLALPPRSPPAPPPTRSPEETADRARSTAAAVPARPVTRDAAPTADWRVRPTAPGEETARVTLRGRLGCRTADMLALTEAERAACAEALAKGAETAPTYAVISPKLKKVFDGTFECPKGDVWCEYRIGKAPYPGLFAPHGKPKDRSWD